MIKFLEPPCYGRLIKRYKRFFMDVALDTGELICAHIPNTGSMLGLLADNSPVLLTKSQDQKRKTSHTAQAIKVGDEWVGINTHVPNKLIKTSLHHPLLRDFAPYQTCETERPYGPNLRSRIDFRFSNGAAPDFYLEIKSVTLRVADQAQFPDAVSQRALKHIEDLLHAMSQGYKAGLIFVIQRTDCTSFSPARSIDPRYSDALLQAHEKGLMLKAVTARVNESGFSLLEEIPCLW